MTPPPSPHVRPRRSPTGAALGYAALTIGAGAVWAVCTNPNPGPDVIVASLYGVSNYAQVAPIDDKRAYSMGTKSLNVGDTVLLWQGSTPLHPVIGQALYRYKVDLVSRPGGRLEQIGMSWLKHGFNALAEHEFCSCTDPLNWSLLGVGCSDPYTAGTNGANSPAQGTDCGGSGGPGGLGSRSEVNPSTGQIIFPYQRCGTGDLTLRKRLIVADADLDPALNPGARYFGEAQYVASDDSAAANSGNNASFREVVLAAPEPRTLAFGGALGATTQQTLPALAAWALIDPAVVLETADVAADGRLHLAAKVHDQGDGTWRYEYAIHNLNSHRSVQRVEVPVPAGSSVTGAGFHDVDYHSGEPYTNTDWTIDSDAPNGFIAWFGETQAANANANALRWGTTYNFWFDADQAPGTGSVALTLFRAPAAGEPVGFTVELPVPGGTGLFRDDFERGTASAWDALNP